MRRKASHLPIPALSAMLLAAAGTSLIAQNNQRPVANTLQFKVTGTGELSSGIAATGSGHLRPAINAARVPKKLAGVFTNPGNSFQRSAGSPFRWKPGSSTTAARL